MTGGKAEVQDVFCGHGGEYLKNHSPPPHVHKAIRAIRNCRTGALGGHVDSCGECGYTKISYNSCRNRNCPKCQALAKERWLTARREELLPVPYFHVVFTLPSELDEIVMKNQELMYGLLFKATAETVRSLAADRKYLGVKVGLTSVLHTWGQNLTFHPHVHMVVPGGGLTKDGRWASSGRKFFIPVKAMSRLFRGKFLYYLKNAALGLLDNGSIDEPGRFGALLDTLYQKEWYVYCKRPFKTTHSVLEYLGRYTHRIAISNHRIISTDDGKVSFKYRDYQDKGKEKLMTLQSGEFMRRFLLHVLPPRFVKIRHYGFLATAVKGKELVLCFKLLGMKPEIIRERPDTAGLIKKLTGVDIYKCPSCGSSLIRASPDNYNMAG
jgi:hypothetical protein